MRSIYVGGQEVLIVGPPARLSGQLVYHRNSAGLHNPHLLVLPSPFCMPARTGPRVTEALGRPSELLPHPAAPFLSRLASRFPRRARPDRLEMSGPRFGSSWRLRESAPTTRTIGGCGRCTSRARPGTATWCSGCSSSVREGGRKEDFCLSGVLRPSGWICWLPYNLLCGSSGVGHVSPGACTREFVWFLRGARSRVCAQRR